MVAERNVDSWNRFVDASTKFTVNEVVADRFRVVEKIARIKLCIRYVPFTPGMDVETGQTRKVSVSVVKKYVEGRKEGRKGLVGKTVAYKVGLGVVVAGEWQGPLLFTEIG